MRVISAHYLLIRPNLPDTIALVTPITSKGKIIGVESMPLFSVSVPSLCKTASPGYHYTYFLCYTQGDSVFGDAAVVQHHFDQVGPPGLRPLPQALLFC